MWQKNSAQCAMWHTSRFVTWIASVNLNIFVILNITQQFYLTVAKHVERNKIICIVAIFSWYFMYIKSSNFFATDCNTALIFTSRKNFKRIVGNVSIIFLSMLVSLIPTIRKTVQYITSILITMRHKLWLIHIFTNYLIKIAKQGAIMHAKLIRNTKSMMHGK